MSFFLEDRKSRVMKGYHKAIDAYQERDTVGSRYVYDVEDKVATYIPEENVYVRSTYEVPVLEPIPPPQYFDFITGIERIRDGGKLPDWTASEKAYPLRVLDFSRPLRMKYEAALASRVKPDVLYNPSRLTLYTFPEVPIYYSGKQSWHSKMRDLPGRTYVSETSGLLCYMSFDTVEREYPEKWIMLVPHPAVFKDSYPDGMVEWDGQSIRYTWTTSAVHSTVVTPSQHFYYTTSQTDQLLQNSVTGFSAAKAYWWYQSFPVSQVKVPDESTFRPSYTVPVSHPISTSGAFFSYLSARRLYRVPGVGEEAEIEQQGIIDLDQLWNSANVVPSLDIDVYEEDRKIVPVPGDQWDSQDQLVGFPDTSPLIVLVDGELTGGYYVREMGFTMLTVPARRIGKSVYPERLPRNSVAIADNSHRMHEHLLSQYYKRRRKVFSRIIDRPPGITLTLGDDFQGKPFIELIKEVESVLGPTTANQVKAIIRRQGGMIIRTRLGGSRDRYIMFPVLPGVVDPRGLWSFIHRHRTTYVRVSGVVTKVFKRQFLDICSHNGLVAWYNATREEFFVSDPHSIYDWSGVITVSLEPFRSPIYATQGKHDYYYPFPYVSTPEVIEYYDCLLGEYTIHGLPEKKSELESSGCD